MSKTMLVPAMALAALIGALTIFFFALFEKREITVEKPMPEGTRFHDYLAAEKYLQKKGFEVSSLDTFVVGSPLPLEEGVLVMIGKRHAFTRDTQSYLLDWVEAGGHLIVTGQMREQEDAQNPFDETEEDPLTDTELYDPLLEYFDIEMMHVEKTRSLEIAFEGETDTYTINLPRDIRYITPDDYEGSSINDVNNDIALVVFSHGDGLVTVLPDTQFFNNTNISKLDHAAFLNRIITLHGEPNEVVIVYRELFPSIWKYLWIKAWMVLVGTAVFICFYLWYRIPRLGPILKDPPLARRSLLEHVDAVGRFFWTQGQAARLVNATRDAMMDRLRLRRPDWLAATPEELAGHLAESASLTREQIQSIMEPQETYSADEFFKHTTWIEQVRRSL